MTNFAFLMKYLKNSKWHFVIGVILSIFSIIFVLLLPQITQLFIDSVYTFSNTENASIGAFWTWFVSNFGDLGLTQIVLLLSTAFIVCAILKNTCKYFASRKFFKVGAKALGDVRKNAFKRLAHLKGRQSISESFFNLTKDGDDFFEFYYTALPKMLAYPILITFATTFCFAISWKITLSFLGFAIAIIALGFLFNKKSMQNFREARNNLKNLTQKGEEIISKIREIKVFGNEQWALEKYQNHSQKNQNSIKIGNDYIQHKNIILNFFRVAGIALALLFSALACFWGEMSIGYFVLMASYAFMIFSASIDFTNNNFDLGIWLAGIQKLKNLSDGENPDAKKPDFGQKFSTLKFENVGIANDQKKIFANLNLEFKAGKHYALKIGQGQGKTALSRVIMMLDDITSGQMLLNGVDVQNFNAVSIRKQFSFVSQEPYIFEGTLAQNIAMFEDVDAKKLQKVIAFCHLGNLVRKLPLGANTLLVENGTNLTTQERQKINFARAIYKNTSVILIDNAFNKFDKEFTKKMLAKIRRHYKNRCVILLSNDKNQLGEFENVISLTK